MKKWKASLLLAAGLVVSLSTAAMASQAKSGESDYVTVEVKNCKGGAIDVSYEDYDQETGKNSTVALPIGEKVQIPKGTEVNIYIDPIYYYDAAYDSEVTEYPKSLHVTMDGKDEVVLPDEWADCIYVNDKEINGNCVIDADFVAEMDASGIGDDLDAIPEEKRNYTIRANTVYYDSPSIVKVDLICKKGSKIVPLSEIPELKIDARSNYYKPEWYQANFELTSTGIRSKGVLPLGYYRIPLMYKVRTESKYSRQYFVRVYVGKKVRTQISLAEFEADGEIESIGDCGIGIWNPDADPDSMQRTFFDAARTKVSDVMKLIALKDMNSLIVGYQHDGTYVDDKGKKVDTNDSRSLSEAAGKDVTFRVTPVLKKGNKTYQPVRIKMIPEGEIIIKYSDSWVEKDGKLYYYLDAYDEDEWTGNKLAKGEWVERGMQDVYCDNAGALVTNGIAGKSLNDGMGLRLVDKKGYMRTDYSGSWTVGMNQYTIVNGDVTDVKIINEVATPSDAKKVETFTDGLESVINNENVDPEKKTEFADKLVTGINQLSDAQKNDLHDDVIEKSDKALQQIYNVEPEVESVENDTFEETEKIGKVTPKGLLAAAGLKSDNNANSVKLQIAQTSSNALMKFDAKLYVGDDENPTQLKSPVIMEVELPKDVQKTYSKYGYTYKLVHVGENGTDVVKDGETKNGLSLELSADMKTATIRTNSFSTFELQVVRKASDSGTDTPSKPTNPTNPTTPATPNKPNNSGSGSSSDSDDSDSSNSGNSYRRTKNSPAGNWVQDAKGWWYRRADGSCPKSQWIELSWNGVSSWYYFNESGYMATGWREDGGYTYYLNPVSDGTSGQMVTGWRKIDNIWYYFNKLTGGPQGSLLKNTTTPDGYQVGANGAWIQ